MAAGNFTCADLVTVQVKQEMMWADAQIAQDYTAEVDVVKAIQAEQTVTLVPLTDSTKDYDISMSWIQDCATDADIADCANDCTVGGTELEAKCQGYNLNYCKTIGFQVKEKYFRGSVYSKEEVIARGMMKRKKLLDEYIAGIAVAKLDAFAGINDYAGGVGTVSGHDTYIPAPAWTPDLLGYLTLTSKMNKFANPYLMSGTNLYLQYWNAQMNAKNLDGSGAAEKIKALRAYFDVFNIDSVLSPDKKSFLIDRNAIAFISKHYYSATPIEYAFGVDQIRYAVQSDNLPGVWYDVVYTTACVSNEIIHKWSLTAKFDFLLNPVGCNTDRTGILSFVCGPVPAP